MKPFKLMPLAAALIALGLGLFSVAPSLARADDETSEAKTEKGYIHIVDEDSDSNRDSDRESYSGAYLGVQMQRLSAALRRAKGIPESTEGVLVSSVQDGSPADQGGIRRGDVILELNRESTETPSDLVRVVGSLETGKRVSVIVWRDGVTRNLSVKLGTRPEGSDVPSPPRPPVWEDRGDSRDRSDGEPRMRILRRNRADLERQIRELQEQLRQRSEDLARLEREVRQLRSDLQRQIDRRDRDRDRDRNDDRDRDDEDDDD